MKKLSPEEFKAGLKLLLSRIDGLLNRCESINNSFDFKKLKVSSITNNYKYGINVLRRIKGRILLMLSELIVKEHGYKTVYASSDGKVFINITCDDKNIFVGTTDFNNNTRSTNRFTFGYEDFDTLPEKIKSVFPCESIYEQMKGGVTNGIQI